MINGPKERMKGGTNGLGCAKGDIRAGNMSAVSATVARDRGDGFGLSMAEIARLVGMTTSKIAKMEKIEPFDED
jgi:hypothetical protein